MDLLKEIKKIPKEIEIQTEEGNFNPSGLCLRWRVTLEKWSVGYGARNCGKYVGFGDTLEEAFKEFLIKQNS